MTDSVRDDTLWQVAIGWVMLEYDQRPGIGVREALFDWLAQDPAHRAAYEQASLLWLMTGLVPSSEEAQASSALDQDE